MSEYTVPLTKVMEEFHLTLLTPAVSVEDKVLTQANINRPALQLTGYFDYFDPARLQIIGMVEHTYLQKIDAHSRNENLRRIFQHRIPAIVVCRRLGIFPEMLDYAEK